MIKTMRILWLSLLAGLLPALAQFVTANPDPTQVPSGTYQLDAGHGKITWMVMHHGLSTYIGQFSGVSATLKLDSANPAASTLDVTVDTNSIGTFNDALDDRLKSDQWFDTADYPTAHYVSTTVTRTGPRTATINGNLTLHGVTKPVAIAVTFNGFAAMPDRTVAGFDGQAVVKRTEFGMTTEFPGVSDDVKLLIEGEFEQQ